MTRPENRLGAAAVEVAGFVLAGGESARMGQDKSLVPFAGRPLIEHALSALREAGITASIAGARSGLASFAPVIPDLEPARGPLSGISAALASVQAELAVFLSVDLPLLPPALLAYLVHHATISGATVTLASLAGFQQTFPVVLNRSALPAFRDALQKGSAGCFTAFRAAAASCGQPVRVIPVEFLTQTGQVRHSRGLSASHWFININRPIDLARAQSLRGMRIA